MLKKSRGRPSKARPNIILAAREQFLEHGLDVSLDKIAVKAGTTRQTLYNHFPTKTALLIEIFENFKAEMETPFDEKNNLNEIMMLEQLLIQIGQTVQNHFYNTNVIRLQRLIIIALVEMPEILEQVQQRTYGSIKKSMINILETANNAGIIKISNSEAAAKAFLGAVMGYAYPATLLGGAVPTSEELQQLNEEACRTFLSAWQFKIEMDSSK
ncbi:TetR family transcriptional regulator [Acinetobacter sp. RIT698]|jgi:TetR/AcrR family transcriptional repressor of mexJK operon|uniref:TetR/AcrR family transcriptional regulator n=1 Tax=Acinetobacter TaxID=469 RepID=UPI0012AC9C17|nr:MULTISPECIES: TetR/AcrR family transcriptional regulator [Acinetobacter]MCS4296752.1 TetR/AcrR family transcriptional repressor of mexJK operon [Acinetobacter guillouiae]MCW2250874.1 TetR/AcrR family transcriptional repressor of mexJK operon [Acinetobacter sp. BIGb0204]MRT39346.1 TetR family transcriptional regulator [Acinetobacter sp. RIT698]NII37028.1 TetR/AcrR family transcriptional repressor of mexJK operon [Acinetobacter sp. BIGb0196]